MVVVTGMATRDAVAPLITVNVSLTSRLDKNK